MAGMHTVKQGEYIALIAAQYGFSNWQDIWNLPQNSALKNQRQNPNVLCPGDQVYVPDLEVKNTPKPTDNTHKFTLTTTTLKLRLTLQDMYEKPIANAKCVLSLNGNTINVTTDGSGNITQTIPSTTQNGVLVILDSQTPFNNVQIPLLVGGLDPVTEVSGQKTRLQNLGYALDVAGSPGDDGLESAVEEFQCDNGLTVDGICGPVTQAKLKQVYGC